MAIDGYTVNGPATIFVGTGTSGAYQLLGYTIDGADIQIEELSKEIMTDVMGDAPQDVQNMGMTARITAPLIAMDRTVLATVTGRGDRAAAGQISTIGLVRGMAGFLFAVGIASPADAPWAFPYCYMKPGFGTKLASKANPFRCEFYAIPFAPYTQTAAVNTPLWTRSAV
jgi:hypothetical protein